MIIKRILLAALLLLSARMAFAEFHDIHIINFTATGARKAFQVTAYPEKPIHDIHKGKSPGVKRHFAKNGEEYMPLSSKN